jgi:hypothetical protein
VLRPSLIRFATPLALSLLLAACASGARGRTSGSDVVVEVTNDLVPPTAVTVRIRTSDGRRVVVGGVAPSETRSLRYDESAYPGRYTLEADPSSGQSVASNSFALFPGARVVWRLRTNPLNVISERF